MKFTYKQIEIDGEVTSIERTASDGSIASIPLDTANSDYQAYLAAQEGLTNANNQSAVLSADTTSKWWPSTPNDCW